MMADLSWPIAIANAIKPAHRLAKAVLPRLALRHWMLDGPSYSRTVAAFINECTACGGHSHCTGASPPRTVLMLCPYLPSKWFYSNYKHSDEFATYRSFRRAVRKRVRQADRTLPSASTSPKPREPEHITALRNALAVSSLKLKRYLVLSPSELAWLSRDRCEQAWFTLFCNFTSDTLDTTADDLTTAIITFDRKRRSLDWQLFNNQYAFEWNSWDELCKMFSATTVQDVVTIVDQQAANNPIEVAGRRVPEILEQIRERTQHERFMPWKQCRLWFRNRGRKR